MSGGWWGWMHSVRSASNCSWDSVQISVLTRVLQVCCFLHSWNSHKKGSIYRLLCSVPMKFLGITRSPSKCHPLNENQNSEETKLLVLPNIAAGDVAPEISQKLVESGELEAVNGLQQGYGEKGWNISFLFTYLFVVHLNHLHAPSDIRL